MNAETFPSKDWFRAMEKDSQDRRDVYRDLGAADLRLVVEVVDGDHARRFGLVLDGYDVLYAGELDDVDAFHGDVTVTGSAEVWREMIANIVTHGGADRTHTLNALSIAEAPLRAWSADPVGRDKFFRYAETLQTLFDSLGAVELART